MIAAADLRRIFANLASTGGDPSAIDTGGIALPRAGEAAVQIIQGQPAPAYGQPRTPSAPVGEVVYVVGGEGTQVYSLKDYLAGTVTLLGFRVARGRFSIS